MTPINKIGQAELVTRLAKWTGGSPSFFSMLGAGASLEAGIPLTGEIVLRLLNLQRERSRPKLPPLGKIELARRWAKRSQDWYRAWLNDPAKDRSEYEVVVGRVLSAANDRAEFFGELIANADVSKALGNLALARLMRRGLVETIVTTNFDDVLQELFDRLPGRRLAVPVLSEAINHIDPCSHEPRLIRLHGDLSNRDIANTTSELLTVPQERLDAVLRLCLSHRLVVIGYSGADRRLMRDLFGKMTNAHTRNGVFWCLRRNEEPCEELKQFLAKGLDGVSLVKINGFQELMADLEKAVANKVSDAERSRRQSELLAVFRLLSAVPVHSASKDELRQLFREKIMQALKTIYGVTRFQIQLPAGLRFDNSPKPRQQSTVIELPAGRGKLTLYSDAKFALSDDDQAVLQAILSLFHERLH